MYGGGPCDFSVSPSPFGLDHGTLDFGLTKNVTNGTLLHFSNSEIFVFRVFWGFLQKCPKNGLVSLKIHCIFRYIRDKCHKRVYNFHSL